MREWAFVICALSLMLCLAWFTLHSPEVSWRECEYVYLPSLETRLGFKGGRVRVQDDWIAYTLVRVDPQGVLGKAGFRSGDVPVAYHGGPLEFCAAVRWSESGRESFPVSVRNIQDWEAGSRRKMAIPALAVGATPP